MKLLAYDGKQTFKIRLTSTSFECIIVTYTRKTGSIMNEHIKALAKEHFCSTEFNDGTVHECYEFSEVELAKFVELIARECIQLNRKQSYELAGVIVDTELGHGFDDICLNTIKRVEQYLLGNTIKEHFGVEE